MGSTSVDGAWNIYVAGVGYNRGQKFSKDGDFLLKFGALSEPLGIAVDGVGNVQRGRSAKFLGGKG